VRIQAASSWRAAGLVEAEIAGQAGRSSLPLSRLATRSTFEVLSATMFFEREPGFRSRAALMTAANFEEWRLAIDLMIGAAW
jgi:hypothetical protein